MPIRYPVEIPGCENKKVELQVAGFITPIKLLVDGEPAQPGNRRNELVVRGKNGKPVSVYVQSSFFDTVPQLRVDGKTIRVVPPLKWYEYIWCGIPLFLVFTGGMLGAITSLIAFISNISIARTKMNPLLRYLVIGLVSAAAWAVYFLIAVILTVMLDGS